MGGGWSRLERDPDSGKRLSGAFYLFIGLMLSGIIALAVSSVALGWPS